MRSLDDKYSRKVQLSMLLSPLAFPNPYSLDYKHGEGGPGQMSPEGSCLLDLGMYSHEPVRKALRED